MRYDSMLATALAFEADDVAGQAAQWRQLVDLIVQARHGLSATVRSAVLERIALLRAAVPVEQRRLAALQIAERAAGGDAVALFGADAPGVAAPVLSTAKLDGKTWQSLIPQLPPASRALLRNRRDLPAAAMRALSNYGLSDFALPASQADVVDAGNQIRDLVARIEAFRLGANETSGSPRPVPVIQDFGFETSVDGLIDWTTGAPREALIGTSIADIADDGGFGVDGQAAGAFRRRAPFRNARLVVAGPGPVGGQWLISATPVFNPRNGRFAGYHGHARRPQPDEISAPLADFGGTAIPVDALRQLIHELRTPLNAILGFAAMIDSQLLGPSAQTYRVQARAILDDGERLLDLIDDLDQAARARSDTVTAPLGTTSDAAAVLHRIESRLGPALAKRDVELSVTASSHVEISGVDPATLERMIGRLISAASTLAVPGECIHVDVSHASGGQTKLTVARPAALSGVTEAVLLDPAYAPEMPYPDAPLLGLGFTLRLIRSLARDAGGQFAVLPDRFVLTFPSAQVRADLPAGTR